MSAIWMRSISVSVGLMARRPLALTPQEAQVSHPRRIEIEAVAVPLDHAFSFQLADVGGLQSRCCASADALTVKAPLAMGALYGNGLRHRVGSCCVAAGSLRLSAA
ncbi:hypothetical protein [Bradyrhizobium sp. McL0616]|uniref:hypothetical protein n=1 Tax=Bradyrhizobium sp. McL0616 TaxID=3415674 RepID=UPI003CF52BCD